MQSAATIYQGFFDPWCEPTPRIDSVQTGPLAVTEILTESNQTIETETAVSLATS